MVYEGTVRQGVVVLEGSPPLKDGTRVRVEPVVEPAVEPAGEPRRGSAEAILRHAGSWVGPDEEIDRLLAELRQMKQDELRNQQDEPDPQL